MPKSFAGIFAMTLAAIVSTALGIAVLSRTPLWKFIVGAPKV